MTIYSYCRTSELEASLEQEELDSILEPEMLAIQTYCLRQSWFMTETLKDTNCNWNQEFGRRESGRRLMNILQPGDVILASKLERICSSSHEVIKLVKKLKEKSVQLHIVELGGDITDPVIAGNLRRGFDASDADQFQDCPEVVAAPRGTVLVSQYYR
jgi:putative DNA-invertase from lambdoid prophage Rac